MGRSKHTKLVERMKGYRERKINKGLKKEEQITVDDEISITKSQIRRCDEDLIMFPGNMRIIDKRNVLRNKLDNLVKKKEEMNNAQ